MNGYVQETLRVRLSQVDRVLENCRADVAAQRRALTYAEERLAMYEEEREELVAALGLVHERETA